MNSFRIPAHIMIGSLTFFSAACGEPTAEDTAAEIAAATTSVVSALSTTTEMGKDAADAQTEGLEEPNAPQGDDVRCVSTELENGRLRVDYGAGCEINGHVFSGVYSIGLSLFRGFGVVLEYEDFRKDNLLHTESWRWRSRVRSRRSTSRSS